MACEEYLEQMENAAIAMDEIDADISQLMFQRAAQEGILIGSYMQYMICLQNQQGGRMAQTKSLKTSPSVSDICAWVKKLAVKLKRKKK